MFIECISPYFNNYKKDIITVGDTEDLTVEAVSKYDLYKSCVDFFQRPNLSGIGGITDMNSCMVTGRLSSESRTVADAIAVSFIYVDDIPIRFFHLANGERRINNFVLENRMGMSGELTFNYIVAFKGYYLIRLVLHALGNYNLGFSALMDKDGKVLDYWVKDKAHHNISCQSEIIGVL